LQLNQDRSRGIARHLPELLDREGGAPIESVADHSRGVDRLCSGSQGRRGSGGELDGGVQSAEGFHHRRRALPHRRCAGLELACAHDAAELVTDEVEIRTAGDKTFAEALLAC
jgi:hypothetical protein